MVTRLGMVLLLVLVETSATGADRRPGSAELLDLLGKSTRPLSEGAEDCIGLAKYHSTLGALVQYFGQQANGRRTASCARPKETSGALACSAEFVNKVPRERSEDEFSLRIDFELQRGAIGAFKCFMAG